MSVDDCIELQNASIPGCGKAPCQSQITYKWEKDSVHHVGSGPDVSIIDSIKYSIYMYGPVVATYIVYMDFLMGSALNESDFVNDTGVTSVSMGVKKPWTETNGIYIHGAYDYTSDGINSDQTISGAHSVVIVGWGNGNAGTKYGDVGYWIVRNSWSIDWGYDGYFHIAMTNKLKNINEFVYLDIPTSIDGNEFGGCVAAFPHPALLKWDPIVHPVQYKHLESTYIDEITEDDREKTSSVRTVVYSVGIVLLLLIVIITIVCRVKKYINTYNMVYTWCVSACVFIMGYIVTLATTPAETSHKPEDTQTVITNDDNNTNIKINGESDIKTQTHNLYVRMPLILRKLKHTVESYNQIAVELVAAFTANESSEQLYFGIKDPNLFVSVRLVGGKLEYMIMDTILFPDGKTRIYELSSDGTVGELQSTTTTDFDVHTREWFTHADKHTTAWTKPYKFANLPRYGISYVMEYDRDEDPNKDIVVASDASADYMLFVTPTELQYIIGIGDTLFVAFIDDTIVDVDSIVLKLKVPSIYPLVFVDINHYKPVAITYKITEFPAIMTFKDKEPLKDVMYGLNIEEFERYVKLVTV
jgi:hypothetical protein